MKRIILLTCIAVAFCPDLFAQDPLFSQFYHSPLYLNPAFSGCAKTDFRLCFSSRLQYMNLPSPLQYHSASADLYMQPIQASVGLILNRFGEGYLKTTQVSLIGSRSFGNGLYDCTDWFLNFAFQLNYSWKNVDRSKLLFSDQLDLNGLTGLPSEVELSKFGSIQYFDVTAGVLATYRRWMIGFAGHHLTQPDNSPAGSTEDTRLPYRVTAHTSVIIDRFENENLLIKPTAIFHLQGASRSFAVGSLFEMPDGHLEMGVWYRNNMSVVNNHSLSVGFNIKLGKNNNPYNAEPDSRYRTGLSYDAELNRPGVRYTRGSTELGMLYEKNLLGDQSTCPKPLDDCGVRYPWMFH